MPSFLYRHDRFVTELRDDAWSPHLLAGDYLVVTLDETPRPNRIVVILTPEGLRLAKSRRKGDATVFEDEMGAVAWDQGAARQVGYVVAVLRDFAEGRGKVEWDDGGLGI